MKRANSDSDSLNLGVELTRPRCPRRPRRSVSQTQIAVLVYTEQWDGAHCEELFTAERPIELFVLGEPANMLHEILGGQLVPIRFHLCELLGRKCDGLNH